MHLRGLPLDHVDLPHFSRVSWMAYSDPIRPFLEGMTRFTEIVWCHGRDQRVLRRQDLDLRIGDRLLGLRFCDDRHDLPHRRLRWRRLEQARDRDENSTDRDQTRGDTNKRLEPGQCGTERRETLPESHQAAERPGGSRVAGRRCHVSALSLFDWITAPTRHTAAPSCKQGKCRTPTMNFTCRYRRRPRGPAKTTPGSAHGCHHGKGQKEGQCPKSVLVLGSDKASSPIAERVAQSPVLRAQIDPRMSRKDEVNGSITRPARGRATR